MRKILFLLPLIVLMTAAGAHAQKIGVVDYETVLRNSEPGKKARSELEQLIGPEAEKLKQQKQAIDKLREEYENQRMMLSQEAARDKESEYKTKVRDFLREQQELEKKTELEFNRLLSPVIEVLDGVLEDYAKKNGFDIILDSKVMMLLGASPYRGIHYYSDAVDLTKQITGELNRAWRARNQ